jgi:hypothetical protein
MRETGPGRPPAGTRRDHHTRRAMVRCKSGTGTGAMPPIGITEIRCFPTPTDRCHGGPKLRSYVASATTLDVPSRLGHVPDMFTYWGGSHGSALMWTAPRVNGQLRIEASLGFVKASLTLRPNDGVTGKRAVNAVCAGFSPLPSREGRNAVRKGEGRAVAAERCRADRPSGGTSARRHVGK